MTTQVKETGSAAEPARPQRGRLKRLVLGRPADPVWARPGLWAVLVLAAVLYSWDLSRNGDANTFYAAAVLSGTESWKAFWFGSLDSASFITVDKPPFAFWVMGISARIFGFNSWSLLLPQAAEGVAAVAVVYAAVRRSVGGLTGQRGAHAAGLIAALALALTPVVVAIDRDDNPDTMLTLLLVLGAWGLLESLRASRPDRDAEVEGNGHPLLWLMLSAVAFGLAFNTKMFEGFIPLPALAIVYLVAASGTLRVRIGRLLAAGGVLAVIALSWMTIVDLIPKSSRPYVGSSANDTVWNLAVVYNGFGRLTGSAGFGRVAGPDGTDTGAFPGAGAGTGAGRPAGGALGEELGELARRFSGGGFGGQVGIGRIFAATLGGQISWLLPFAAIALVGTLILIGRRPRTDLARASVMLWGGWLLLEFFVLSFQQGIQHTYYTSAMAPPIAALTGIGAVVFYQAYRRSGWWSLALPMAIAVTGVWAFVLLRRTPGWNPWLSWTVLAATAVAVLALALGRLRPRRADDDAGQPQGADQADARGRRRGAIRPTRLLALAGVASVIAVLAGPAAYAATPLLRPIEGTNPVAGPAAAGGFAGFGGAGGALRDFRGLVGARTDFADAGSEPGNGRIGSGPAGGYGPDGASGRLAGADGGAVPIGGGFGGAVSQQLISYLKAHRDGATWLVAVQGSSAAAAVILQTGGIPVMAIGGFTGTDAAPTVAQIEQYVKQGKLHYVMTGGRGGFGGGGGNSTVASVISWVEQNCTGVPASAYGGSVTAAGVSAPGAAATVAQALYHCG